MPDHTYQKPPPETLRQFHSIKWIWAAVFVLLAGPLNLAGLFLGWPKQANIILDDVVSLIFIVLMPTCVIALFMLWRMLRAGTFTVGDLWIWLSIGYFLAVLSGPLGFALSEIYLGKMQWYELGEAYFLFLTLGTAFGIVPFFAAVIGLPCALVAMIAAYACSTPVDLPRQHNPSQTRKTPINAPHLRRDAQDPGAHT